MANRRFRLLKWTLIIAIPILIIWGGLVYMKMVGFRRALEELVDQRTNGQYALRIGRSSVDVRKLSFQFDSLLIIRNGDSLSSGIRRVRIPSLTLRFGTLPSMIAFQKFDIKKLVIVEPEIEIAMPRPQVQGAVETPRVGQQIVNLYPAVESLLSRFEIESLTVQRASVHFQRNSKSLLHLRLIDLLVEHWDIQNITPRSQLQLKIAGQELNFGKAVLDFSEVEFNFQRHYLLFSDFGLTSTDPLSNSKVEVEGKSLLLERLDYKALQERERYSLAKAVIDSPYIRARLRLKKKDIQSKDKNMLTRILKQSMGECSIDSTIIRHARVDLALFSGKDSVKVDLPQVDFKLHSFRVIEDSSTFQVGEIEINLNRTAVSLGNNINLGFEKVFFDQNRDLTVANALVFDALHNQQIIRAGSITLRNFNLPYFAFYKHVLANDIVVRNADVRIHSRSDGRAASGEKGIVNELDVGAVLLRNTRVTFDDSIRHVVVEGMDVDVSRVLYVENRFRYNIRRIRFKQASVAVPRSHVEGQVIDGEVNGSTLSAAQTTWKKDSVQIAAVGIHAESDGEIIKGNVRRWKSVSLMALSVSGAMHNANQRDSVDVEVQRLSVNKLEAAIRSKATSYSLHGDGITIDSLVTGPNGTTWGRVGGDFADIDVSSPGLHATAAAVHLIYPLGLSLQQVDVAAGSSSFNLAHVVVQGITRSPSWKLTSILCLGVLLKRDQATILRSDSVSVYDADIGTVPVIDKLEIFHPVITLPNRKGNGDKPLTKLPRELILHPGKLTLPNGKEFVFGKTVRDHRQGTLTTAFVTTDLDRGPLRIDGISLSKSGLKIDSVRLKANQEWVGQHMLEESEVDAGIFRISVSGMTMDSLLIPREWKNLDVAVDSFAIRVFRDKQLPDQPFKEKPHILENLIHLPARMKLHTIRLRKGRINYRELSDKTGEVGTVSIENISASVGYADDSTHMRLDAHASINHSGSVELKYQTLDTGAFKLDVHARDMDLTTFNEIVVPLQAIRIRSGYLKELSLNITADGEVASGLAEMSYRNLSVELYKKGLPDRKNFGTELLTLVANKIVLKHKREKAQSMVEQKRLKDRSIFNYWVKCIIKGATGVVKGENKKPGPAK